MEASFKGTASSFPGGAQIFYDFNLLGPTGGGLWVVKPAYILGRNIWKFYNVSLRLELDTNSDPTFTVMITKCVPTDLLEKALTF